jgi:hypothetical protein
MPTGVGQSKIVPGHVGTSPSPVPAAIILMTTGEVSVAQVLVNAADG